MSDLKMSDVFKVSGNYMLEAVGDRTQCELRYVSRRDDGSLYSTMRAGLHGDKRKLECATHAINNHDRLVEEIAQLKADKEELVDRLSLRPVSEITPDFFVTGKKILAWNGYFFEAEWDGEDWCSIGGDDFDFFMTLPSEPLQKHKG